LGSAVRHFYIMSTQNFVEITGATVEEAIEKGLKQLGVGPSQVIVEVLEEPSRGLFGLGSKEARVRLQRLAPASPPPEPPPIEEVSAPQADVASAPPPPPEPKAEEKPQPTKAAASADDVYHGDDDDFFDEDGSYGDDGQPVSSPEKAKTTSTSAYEDLDEGIEVVEQSPEEQARERRERIELPTRGHRYGEGGRGRSGNNRGGRGSDRRSEGGSRGERRSDNKRGGKQGSRGDSRRRRGGRGRGKREESTVVTPPLEFEEGATDVGIGEQVLTEMLDLMDLPATLNTTRAEASDGDGDDGPPWILNIEGESEDVTPLIGRKGETLSSLQYLTRLIVSKQTENRANIIIDVDSYRLKRAEKIGNLANRMADQAIETKRTVILEPMPPHERRIVHMVLRKRDDVETESTGEGKGRRVTIIPNRDTV
jgi:spoIIIJ-associated protein